MLSSNTTGSNNVGIGISTLTNNTTGNYNVAIGYSAGNGGYGTGIPYSQSLGSNNTFVGSYSGSHGTNFSQSTAIGFAATFTDNYQCVIAEPTASKIVLAGAYNYINMDYSQANSLPTPYPLTLTPGAYMMNGGTGASPIFASIPNMADANIFMYKYDDCWTVMPGFKLQLWQNPSYTYLSITCDNTNGSTIALFYPNVGNSTSSLKLWYKGTEIVNSNFNYMGVKNWA